MLSPLGSFSVFLLAAAAAAAPAHAQDDGETTLALTYAYSPKGSGDDLARGYKKHLEWHVARNDPILWYAWFVVEGNRLGHFVDGAYDVTGAEFDARPDPAGDAADAIETFLPVAHPEYRRVFRLRKDLSTSTFLEDRNPSPLMQVVYYHVRPGMHRQFEEAASAISSTISSAVSSATPSAAANTADYTLYEMLTGMDGPAYVMYAPLQSFASFDDAALSLARVAQSAMSGDELRAALANIVAATASRHSEVWQYRADLSLIPDGS